MKFFFKYLKYLVASIVLGVGSLSSGYGLVAKVMGKNKDKRSGGIEEARKMDPPPGIVLIPGGSFMQGGGVNEDMIGRRTLVKVKTLTPYYMDETPVTNGQYREVIELLKANPAEYGVDADYIEKHLLPDKGVWQRDFSHFMGDPLVEYYYEHLGYRDYPVVGIKWEAAKKYAAVKTQYLNAIREREGKPPYPNLQIPTAAQWENAAKGGNPMARYPWQGPYLRNEKGELLANFKSAKGHYVARGYTHTSPVKFFPPNGYGLYDMAGNVAEWCEDAWHPAATLYTFEINPVYRDEGETFKSIKGGSWKDVAYFLQTGVCDYEHKDVPRSYIGFRCVMSCIQ